MQIFLRYIRRFFYIFYYKRFESLNEDVYPTFSICISSPNGGLFRNAAKLDRFIYSIFLTGGSGFYNDGKNYSHFDYDNMVITLRDFVQEYRRKSKGSDKKKAITEYQFDIDKSFKLAYQGPVTICFSKREKEKEDRRIQHDSVYLNLTRLYTIKQGFAVSAFIHMKGQLVRMIRSPSYHVAWEKIRDLKKKGSLLYTAILKNNAIETLRRRPDATKRCNKTLEDENQQWRMSLVKEVGCIPSFEKRFLGGSGEGESLLSTLPRCGRLSYRRLRQDYSPFTNFEASADLYVEPCTEMSSVVTTAEDVIYRKDNDVSVLCFQFYYEENYKEIVNQEAFSLADLWSQVGGFVGIFIGYSIIQIPTTIEEFYKQIKEWCTV